MKDQPTSLAVSCVMLPLELFGQLWPGSLEGGHGFCTNPWQSSEWHSDEARIGTLSAYL